MAAAPNIPCPCDSGRKYKKCCRPLHRGQAAASPEALMRSRFTAYALDLADYIVATTHPDGPMWETDRDAWLGSIHEFSAKTEFSDLKVLGANASGERGTVLFQCVLTQGGAQRVFSEESVFARYDGRWVYHSGRVR
jgi:SEC-C motif domain protein